MNAKTLEAILNRHSIPDTDRPSFRALVDFGMTPDADYRRRLRRGRLKSALDEAMIAMSAPLKHKFP